MSATETMPHPWPGLAPILLLILTGCGSTEANLPVKPEDAPKPLAVSVVAAMEQRLPTTLDVTGTLTADAQTEVASELELRVVEVLVERGQAVAAGQVIARLDREDAANQLREAEATEAQTREALGLNGQPFDAAKTPEAQQARATMERADADFRRYAQLVDEGAVSRAEYDLRRADFLAAKAQFETTINKMRQLYQTMLAQRARAAVARKALEDTLIRAPFAGVIAEKHVNVGRFMKKGDRVATIVRTDPLRIELTIPEGAVASVRKGQKVSFAVQTYPDRRFAGTIAYVGPTLRTDSRALVVEAIVPNPNGLLQPGFFATAGIELPAAQPTVMVPAAAVTNEGGVFKLFVARSDRAEMRIVQPGRQAAGSVEILRGIQAGERVVSPAVAGLADGAPIRVQEGS